MDPVTGRFTTPDPVKDYLNQYSYVGNNPVNRVDPTGMYNKIFCRVGRRASYGESIGGDPFYWLSFEVYASWKQATMSDFERLKILVKIALAAEKWMATSGPEEQREQAKKNAESLEYMLDTGNYSSVVMGDLGTTSNDNDPKVEIAVDVLDLPMDVAVGMIIHEASHVSYIREHGPDPTPRVVDSNRDYEDEHNAFCTAPH